VLIGIFLIIPVFALMFMVAFMLFVYFYANINPIRY